MSNDLPIIHAERASPFSLSVFLDEESVDYPLIIEVTHDDGRARRVSAPCTWTPIFGLDVGDLSVIREVAEKMCVEMENEELDA